MNLYRLDLVSLSLFMQIGRAGSITKGASVARLALAAASKRIADLEGAVGAPLFERHSRGISLTPAGEALMLHAQKILRDVDSMASDLSDYAAGVSGVVHLWANTSAITQFLPTEISSFMLGNPGIRIQLEEQDSDQVVTAVANGRADLGIYAERTPTLTLQTMHWRADRLAIVAPDGHPLTTQRLATFSDALDYDFVSLSRNSSLAQLIASAAADSGKLFRLRIQVRSFDAMCIMVAAGIGIAILPSLAVRPHLKSMGLCEIALDEAWASRELLLCARDFSALSRPARLLFEHMTAASDA